MTKKNTTLEINGRRYDAASGDLISAAGKRIPQPKTSVVQPTVIKPKAKPEPARRTGVSVQPHRPHNARTLMRQAVKKPAAGKRQIKVQTASDSLASQPAAQVVVNKSVKQVDPRRLHKAKHFSRSHLISHFSAIDATPARSPYQPPEPSQPLPVIPATPRAASVQPSKPQTTAQLLDMALQAASAHQQQPATKRRTKRRRGLVAGTVAASVLLLVFAGGHQLSNVRLQMAGAKAGISAGLPGYQPAGYSLSKLDTGPGTVASQYHSNSDNRKYTLTQKKSDWDSQQLRDTFVQSIDPYYETADSNGQPVYLYANGSASWVKDGIWYIVQSHGALSSRQLLDLAASL